MRHVYRLKPTMLVLVSLLLSFAVVLPAEAIMLVSRSQAAQVGRQVEQDIIRQYGGLSNNYQLVVRVQNVGNRAATVSPLRQATYTFRVLNSSVLNAFAAPGGPVLITAGLANALTDQQLAFVLSHEVGHIAAEHGRDAINRAVIAQGLGSLLFGSSSNTVQMGINIMYGLYNRGYSRSQEYQADSLGVQIMRGAGYNPEAAIQALAKLGMQRNTGLNRYTSTHPDVPSRIDRVASMIGVSQTREQQLIQEALVQGGA